MRLLLSRASLPEPLGAGGLVPAAAARAPGPCGSADWPPQLAFLFPFSFPPFSQDRPPGPAILLPGSCSPRSGAILAQASGPRLAASFSLSLSFLGGGGGCGPAGEVLGGGPARHVRRKGHAAGGRQARTPALGPGPQAGTARRAAQGVLRFEAASHAALPDQVLRARMPSLPAAPIVRAGQFSSIGASCAPRQARADTPGREASTLHSVCRGAVGLLSSGPGPCQLDQ